MKPTRTSTMSRQSASADGARAPSGPRIVQCAFAVEVVGVALLVVAQLSYLAANADLSCLHVVDFNDQVTYVTAARSWLDTGRCETRQIYPALVGQDGRRNFLYMPGYCACLAASFACFGYGVIPSLLPSLIAYLVAVIAVFLIARRAFGRAVAWLSVILFACSPMNELFAFLAMAEMPFVAATAVAIAAFEYTPIQFKPYAAPFALALPFLFRETAALLVLLFAALYWARCERALRPIIVMLALSTAALTAIHQSPGIRNRISMFSANFMEDENAKYIDAVTQGEIALTPLEVVRRLPGRIFRQLPLISTSIDPSSLFYVLMACQLAVVPIGLVYGLKHRDGWLLGAALLVGATVLFCAAFYTCKGTTFARMLMFTYPSTCIALARMLEGIVRATKKRARLLGIFGVVAALSLVYLENLAFFKRTQRIMTTHSQRAQELIRTIDRIAPPEPESVVVADLTILPVYQLNHYPARTAFMPANRATFEKLRQSYPVRMIVTGNELTAEELRAIGFVTLARFAYRGVDFKIHVPNSDFGQGDEGARPGGAGGTDD